MIEKNIKSLFLNDEPCIIRPTTIDMKPVIHS